MRFARGYKDHLFFFRNLLKILQDQGDLVVYSDGEYIGIFDPDYIEHFYGGVAIEEEDPD